VPTNEEKRVVAYQGESEPTIAETVTSDTPLEMLNLNWREQDLPERLRTKHVHRLHPYLGKYVPQLVEIFLRKFFKAGDVVADPFMGSGTTLVQANELGINSVGYDVSAFNVILARAKTQRYDLKKLTYEINDILRKTKQKHRHIPFASEIVQLPLFPSEEVADSSLFQSSDTYLTSWFAPQALHELLTYLEFIRTGQYEYADLLRVILSRSARSARLTTHFDLDFPKKPQTEPYHCYKHSRICAPTTEAMKFIERYSQDTLKRVSEYSLLQTMASTCIEHGDSRFAEYGHIDGVITSPPYVGLINYHEQHAYAYHLLGLEDRRTEEIGAAAEGSSQRAKKAYVEAMVAVFGRALQFMSQGNRMIVVAGDRANLYGQIASKLHVEVEAVLERHVNRRTGRRSGEFYESIFIWRKS
jgi:hypothetical protein